MPKRISMATRPPRRPAPMWNGRRLIPIRPSAGLYLVPLDLGDDRRFARLFREAWARIPLGARRRLVRYWRAAPTFGLEPLPGPWHPQAPRPLVGLTKGWQPSAWPMPVVGPEPGRVVEQGFGVCGVAGSWLWFRADHVARMPDEVVRTLVAHELAHVAQHATGAADAMDHWEAEEDVREVLWAWEFDDDVIDEWADANCPPPTPAELEDVWRVGGRHLLVEPVPSPGPASSDPARSSKAAVGSACSASATA